MQKPRFYYASILILISLFLFLIPEVPQETLDKAIIFELINLPVVLISMIGFGLMVFGWISTLVIIFKIIVDVREFRTLKNSGGVTKYVTQMTVIDSVSLVTLVGILISAGCIMQPICF
jgi:hypothetical protein